MLVVVDFECAAIVALAVWDGEVHSVLVMMCQPRFLLLDFVSWVEDRVFTSSRICILAIRDARNQ